MARNKDWGPAVSERFRKKVLRLSRHKLNGPIVKAYKDALKGAKNDSKSKV